MENVTEMVEWLYKNSQINYVKHCMKELQIMNNEADSLLILKDVFFSEISLNMEFLYKDYKT